LINADLIITDSSGVIKETFYAKKMGVTIDNTTEYKEIFDIGYNILAGFKKDFIKKSIISMLSKDFIEPSVYPFGDGHSANRMVEILYQFLGK
jgi:UDP-N-acetylglucosamine 2-epimerase